MRTMPVVGATEHVANRLPRTLVWNIFLTHFHNLLENIIAWLATVDVRFSAVDHQPVPLTNQFLPRSQPDELRHVFCCKFRLQLTSPSVAISGWTANRL